VAREEAAEDIMYGEPYWYGYRWGW